VSIRCGNVLHTGQYDVLHTGDCPTAAWHLRQRASPPSSSILNRLAQLQRHRCTAGAPPVGLVPHAAVRLGELRRPARIQVLGTPVRAVTIGAALRGTCFSSRASSTGAAGGDPWLFSLSAWFYSHSAVYSWCLPSMGVVSEVLSPFSRKAYSANQLVALLHVSLASAGFRFGGHHPLFQRPVALTPAWCSASSVYFVRHPFSHQIFNWTDHPLQGLKSFRRPCSMPSLHRCSPS